MYYSLFLFTMTQNLEQYLLNKSHLEAQTESCVIKAPALSLSCTFTCVCSFMSLYSPNICYTQIILETRSYYPLWNNSIRLGLLLTYRKTAMVYDKDEY